MAIKTYNEQLIEVQTAISKILSGAQSYSIEGRSVTFADLRTLQEEETKLRVLADRETNNGGCMPISHGVLG